MTEHSFAVGVDWTGNRGTGTSGYRAYGRDAVLSGRGKPAVPGSADRAFFGDAARWNPEELLLAALAECHLLSYLHVCADAGVVVTGYTDSATATMRTEPDGSGRMTEAVLRPAVVLADESQRARADALHDRAAELCFIANSVSFPVRHEPVVP